MLKCTPNSQQSKSLTICDEKNFVNLWCKLYMFYFFWFLSVVFFRFNYIIWTILKVLTFWIFLLFLIHTYFFNPSTPKLFFYLFSWSAFQMAWVSERDLEDKFVKSFVNSPSAFSDFCVSVSGSYLRNFFLCGGLNL